MTEEKKHIISKIFVDVNANSVENANKIKNNIEVFLKENLFSLIENYLNTIYIDKNHILQIDKLKLNIDLKSIYLSQNAHPIFESFKKEINKHIKDQLITISETKENSRLISVQDKIRESFFLFLKTGEKPWYIDNESFDKIFNVQALIEIRNSNKFANQFEEILNNTQALKRLILQFSNESLFLLFAKEFPNKSFQFNEDFNRIFSRKSQSHFWKIIATFYKTKDKDELYSAIFNLVDSSKVNAEKNYYSIINIVDKVFSISTDNKKIKSIIEKTRNRKKEKEKDFPMEKFESEYINTNSTNDIITDNMGLILLHPYLKIFLKDCELLDGNNVIVDKEKAVHLLHYAATFKEKDSENNMLFEKFLCNISLHHPIKKDIILSKKIKLKTQDLLSSVIKNWPALKNTSIETLQNEFLQRRGKLILSEDNPKIIIERKTQDILLEKLPWNISIVKIPWIDKIVFVEW